MNGELQEVILEMLGSVTSAASTATGFLTGEIPLYVQELLLWHGWYSAVICVIGAVILVAGLTIDIKVFQSVNQNSSEWTGDDWFIYAVFGLIPRALIYIPSLFALNLTWLQIWIAPRVFLVEYAAKLGGA